MQPDEQLIQRAKSGDFVAAEALFRRYQEPVFGFLVRMTGNPDLAADAMQETFVRGLKALANYTEQHVFKSWLFRIARNEGLRGLQKQSSMPVSGGGDSIPDSTMDMQPRPEEVYEARQKQLSLEQALTTLTQEEQQVVHLRLREDISFKEIAEIMDCPINTAVGRMHSAKKKLQLIMAREG